LGNITSVSGNITADEGNIAATLGSVTAGTTVTGTTGVITPVVQALDNNGIIMKTNEGTARLTIADAGGVSAASTLTAGTGITATTGNIAASSGNVSASGTVTAGTSVGAGTTVTAGTGLVATTGGLTVTAGGATITAGDVTITAGELKGCRESYVFTCGATYPAADVFMYLGDVITTATWSIPMVRAGSIVGLAACVQVGSHTDGATVQFVTKIDNVDKLTLTTAAINDNIVYTPAPATAARGTHTFTAGQILSVYQNLTGTCTWKPIVVVEVVYNT